MGSEESQKSIDSHRRLRPFSHTLLFIFSLVASNLFTFYLFCGHSPSRDFSFRYSIDPTPASASSRSPFVDVPRLSHLLDSLLRHLNLTQSDLHRARVELSDVKAELRAARDDLSGVFLEALYRNMDFINASTQVLDRVAESQGLGKLLLHDRREEDEGEQANDPWMRWSKWLREDDDDSTNNEVREFSAVRKLPLGYSFGLQSETLVSSIGHVCALEDEDLKKFMEYEVGGDCPDDQNLAQRLILHGCEPLPRRRCFAKIPPNFTEPYPIPESFWTLPSDNSILWSAYGCKSFKCLNDRKKNKVLDDCNDCFDLEGKEVERWDRHGSELDFSIDEVLEIKNGTIRIGLDIGGGTASFAVRMRERDVTIITTSMNLNGPFNNFIALRGVIPLYLSISQRLPFFDNTLDIVHSMHVLSNWIPAQTLEFLLFDIDRVLRPGGLLWLDRFFCAESQLDEMYAPMIKRMRYKTHKWAVGQKMDREPERHEVYLSAVLEKPKIRSWALTG